MILGEGHVVPVGSSRACAHMPARAGDVAAVRLVPAGIPLRFSHLPAHDSESAP